MPEDLIGTLLFLASEDSDFLSGQSINVDGGRFANKKALSRNLPITVVGD